MKQKLIKPTMFTLVFLCIFATIFAEPRENLCCSREQGFLRENITECYNGTTNVTSSVSLKCDQIQRLTDADTDILDFLTQFGPQLDHDEYCIANDTAVVVLLCTSTPPEPIIEDHVLGICSFISAVFLVPTVIIYSALPEIRNLQGKSIANLCGSLAMALLLLGLVKTVRAASIELCAAEAFLVYFFFLAAFFWMNAISIQILLNIRRPTVADYGWKPFVWYALYAYGLPALLTVAMAIVNYHPGDHVKPGIGLNSCWFAERQQWYYMYSVMSILIIVNICIFVYTSLLLCRGVYASSNVKALRYKFVMTIRLLIVMGLPWIFEMISSLSPPHIIWAITDILNMLQGLIIFVLLVVFRRRVLKALYKRGYLGCFSNLVEKHLAEGEDVENVVEHTTVDGVEFKDASRI